MAALAASDQPFAVLAHLIYPLRFWPAAARLPIPEDREEEHRAVLEALAASGRALGLNTKPAQILALRFRLSSRFPSIVRLPRLGRTLPSSFRLPLVRFAIATLNARHPLSVNEG